LVFLVKAKKPFLNFAMPYETIHPLPELKGLHIEMIQVTF
jgi:hypothetical protein